MGLTSVSLGHGYGPVLDAVREQLPKGVNFQRPAALERKMAQEFLLGKMEETFPIKICGIRVDQQNGSGWESPAAFIQMAKEWQERKGSNKIEVDKYVVAGNILKIVRR